MKYILAATLLALALVGCNKEEKTAVAPAAEPVVVPAAPVVVEPAAPAATEPAATPATDSGPAGAAAPEEKK